MQPVTPSAAGLLPLEAAVLAQPPLRSSATAHVTATHVVAETGLEGLRTLRILGHQVVSDFAIPGQHDASAHMVSLGMLRSFTLQGERVDERSIAIPNTDALTIEWSATSPVEIVLQWTCTLDSGAVTGTEMRPSLVIAEHDDAVVVRCADNAGNTEDHRIACFAFSRPAAWTINASEARITARITVDADGARLHALYARESAVDDTLGRLRNAVALTRSLMASQKRRATESISIVTPDPALDHAFAWANQRVPSEPMDQRTSAHYAMHALAALATGDADTARTSIARIHEHDPLLLLAAARYHAWTADTRAIMLEWPRLERAAAASLRELDENAPPARMQLLVTALAEIGATAGDIGSQALALELSTRVMRARTRYGHALRSTHWLDAVDDPAARSWQTDPASDPTPAAHPILRIVHGLFGVQPEAARNRLRIAPRLPAEWTVAEIRRIRMGDASVTLRCEQAMGQYTWTATQEEGGVPVRLILEPVIPDAHIIGASVDGADAKLDIQAADGRMVVPVQVVLDDTRTVVLRTAPK